MSKENLRKITNSFHDVRLISLSSWPKAGEIIPRDRNGPYVVLQEGYDPDDLSMKASEFVLGRSGAWLPLNLFYKLPIPERRAEFIFGTAAEVMGVIGNLSGKVKMLSRAAPDQENEPGGEPDDMAAALQAGRQAGEHT
jgi:hypothetical protein